MSKEELVVVVDFKDLKQLFMEKQVRDKNGNVMESMESLVEVAKAFINQQALDVASDNAANGVAIITYSLASKATLVITKLKLMASAAQVISVGFGTALDGTQTNVDHTLLNSPQTWEEFSDGPSPVIAIYNGTAASVNVYVYAPTGAIMGVVNNPAAGAVRYAAVIGGFTF